MALQLREIFGVEKPLIGVIHLPPLPGSPGYGGNLEKVESLALADAERLASTGFHGLIVENLGDSPYFKDRVGPEVVASMTRIALKIRERTGLPLGVNVLRNDAIAALGVATASGAHFIRVNVLVGAVVSDQGIIEGAAAQLLRHRRYISSDVKIFADVAVKHAVSLGLAPREEARNALSRGGADALIVTGEATGEETDPELLTLIKDVAGDSPVLVGSGVTPNNIVSYKEADGFIVGSYIKIDGKAGNPVDIERARRLMSAWEAL